MSEPTVDHLPPQNLAAEVAVLGSMMLDADRIADVALLVTAEDFYSPDHALVYKAILALNDGGKPVDAVTLADRLLAEKELERIGGQAFVASLLDATPSAANAEYYAAMVREAALRRRLIQTSTRIATMAYDLSRDAQAVLEAAESEFYECATQTTSTADLGVKGVLMAVLGDLGKDRAPEVTVPTGYLDLDDLLVGLPVGGLVIIGGRPSHGKSSLATNIALKATVPRFRRPVGGPAIPTLFFTVEDSKRSFLLRCLCCLAKVNSHRLRQGMLNEQEASRVQAAAQALKVAPLYLDSRSQLTVGQLRHQARRLALREPKLDLIVVDYLQLLDGGGRWSSRQEEITFISRQLKALAGDLDAVVLACCQLNRAVETRTNHTPLLGDLRESGSIEQDADLVLFVSRPERWLPGDRPGEADVIVAKHRNGATGQVTLGFQAAFTRFETYIAEASNE